MSSERSPNHGRVHEMTEFMLMAVASEFPEANLAEFLSAALTLTAGLITVTLEAKNDAYNRSEIVKALGSLEQAVWEKAPKNEIN